MTVLLDTRNPAPVLPSMKTMATLPSPVAALPPSNLPADYFATFPTGPRPASRPTQRGGSVAQWLHVARQVLAGEFGHADRSTVESLTIGLRGIPHPTAREALERLG